MIEELWRHSAWMTVARRFQVQEDGTPELDKISANSRQQCTAGVERHTGNIQKAG